MTQRSDAAVHPSKKYKRMIGELKMAKKITNQKPQVIYKPPPSLLCAVTDEPLDYMISCPVCERRAIDFSELPERLINLRYKCPHCRNVVDTPLIAENDNDITVATM